jgi:hypothetical protein
MAVQMLDEEIRKLLERELEFAVSKSEINYLTDEIVKIVQNLTNKALAEAKAKTLVHDFLYQEFGINR